MRLARTAALVVAAAFAADGLGALRDLHVTVHRDDTYDADRSRSYDAITADDHGITEVGIERGSLAPGTAASTRP